jgi:hypothetical protein
MDHIAILNQIRSESNLQRAYYYAFNDRHKFDYYFDYFEMEYVFNNRDRILSDLEAELSDIDGYTLRPAYAYMPPKNDLCYRRMIYLPFKDLVVRYAFVTVVADYLDQDLGPRCFANRRAVGDEARNHLLQDFAKIAWPNFCDWQRDCAERYSVLLRTDISAFYDSVSHDYLIRQVASELSVSEETELMKLFRKILQVPVIAYSHLEQAVLPPAVVRQGLIIGNNVEGFLANLYLKDVDMLMNSIDGIEFGRYNDDMRIFGNSREMVLEAVIVLQEALLAKGLNLNGSKTRIAENEQQVEKLRSKFYEVYLYHVEEYEELEEQVTEVNNIRDEIDDSFDDFDRTFSPDDEIVDNTDAKDYCKFITNMPVEEISPEFIRKLSEIIIRWQGSGKHASWLLVQSACWNGVPLESKELASFWCESTLCS